MRWIRSRIRAIDHIACGWFGVFVGAPKTDRALIVPFDNLCGFIWITNAGVDLKSTLIGVIFLQRIFI